MDKELNEKMDKLYDKLLDTLFNELDNMRDTFKEATSKPCKIHIDNDGKDTALNVKGGRLTILITLAGTEKRILKYLHCTNEEFEFIKNIVGAKEVNDNE